MAKRDAKALGRPKLEKRNPGNVPLKLSARDEQVLRQGRGGQADDTRWLPEAAAGAMQAVGTDRLVRGAFGLAAKALGRAAPVFRPVPAKSGGVHVPRSAATGKDAEALALYDRLLDGREFGSLPREAQLDIVRRTGWQGLPTGEAVKQLPGFEFGPGWGRYEPYATETRAVLSKVAENDVASVPPMTMSEAFAGKGAEELFRRYPNARNWIVRAGEAPAARVMGFSEPGSTAVTVTDEALMRGAEPVLGTAHHETQHVVQNMSRMSPGSTSADALAELRAGVRNAVLDGRGGDPAVVRAAGALEAAERSSDPAYFAYQHAGGEAGAFAAGNSAVEGRAGELITDAMSREGIMPEKTYDLRALRQDAKGGEDRFSMSRNFLATDKVPDTIFGIPVVSRREDYTKADLEFFREHPEAGGYYDLGEDEEGTPEDGTAEGAPVQDDEPRKVPFDPAKDRLQVPRGREKEFEAYMDKLASLFNPVVWDEKNDRPVLKDDGKTFLGKDPSRPASNLVPPNWRERQGKGEFDRDYDYVAAFLAGAEPGINPSDNAWHMGDVGKMPTHETFSNESYYARDPKWAPYAGRWEGETYIPPKARETRQVSNGGETRGKYPGISNNPGNVEKHERRTDKTLFDGEIGGGKRPKRFANFDDPVKGLNAMAIALARRANELEKAGSPFTLGNYIPKYAPASENDTEGYIRDMSRYTGFDRDAALDRWNVDDMANLLRNAVRFESGKPHSDWFTNEEYRAAAERLQEGAAD